MNQRVHRIAEALLGKEHEEFSERQKKILTHVTGQSAISRDVNTVFDEQVTFGQRAADVVASFGGSWTFIMLFGVVLVVWAISNVVILGSYAFDPYPFVFLNLLLSMLAALQAPIIMMSQNRQSAKDRLAVEHDYDVNLKAEIEICQINEKLDELRIRQLAEVIDLHQKQIVLLEQLVAEQRVRLAVAGNPSR